MNFFDAMKELEKGKKVRNTLWNDDLYLYKENKTICFSDACISPYLNIIELNKATWELYKGSILDKTEKAYILNIIKPFKNNVRSIIKLTGFFDNNDKEYIQICVKSDINEYITLPYFISGSMYNKMKLNYAYSLKELGLNE